LVNICKDREITKCDFFWDTV